MKTAAQIFIILGMVINCWTIVAIVFGVIALKQMQERKPETWVSVCVLLFCNLIGGILLLCAKDEDFAV